ncbi:MAG TPA: c-type cytochrome [Gemmatimonadaceae bacterium]|nr:c-type cytochrome [Gemmatimonadaceae bacterium]
MKVAPNVLTSIAVVGAMLAVIGCQQQAAEPRSRSGSVSTASAGTVAYRITPTPSNGVEPGIHPTVFFGDVHNPYAGDATAATEGRQLFVQYNCSGCHGGRAGGGMGPSLRDSIWIYGSSDAQLLGTITEGRPAGMPTWGGRIPQNQMWQIITYIRSLGTPQEPDAPPPPANPPLGQ